MQCELSDPDLGTLALGTDPYIVPTLEIGSPVVREVVRNRALADGALDDTKFLGTRAITMAIRFNDVGCNVQRSMQELIDDLTPYMSPRRRPTLTWALPGSDDRRAAIVRGAAWPFVLEGPKAQTIALQWVVPSGEILAGGPEARRCTTIKPSGDVEAGRTYNWTPPRVYPPSEPIGSRKISNPGTANAHWTLTIFGPVTNPDFTINGIKFAADRRGGVVIAAGQTLVVDTRSRTVLLNGVAGASRYQNVNFEEWTWDDLLLRPGDNTVRFQGTALNAASAAEICYTPTYL